MHLNQSVFHCSISDYTMRDKLFHFIFIIFSRFKFIDMYSWFLNIFYTVQLICSLSAFHTCVVCKQRFISYIALVRHKAVEHGVKPGKSKKIKDLPKQKGNL